MTCSNARKIQSFAIDGRKNCVRRLRVGLAAGNAHGRLRRRRYSGSSSISQGWPQARCLPEPLRMTSHDLQRRTPSFDALAGAPRVLVPRADMVCDG